MGKRGTVIGRWERGNFRVGTSSEKDEKPYVVSGGKLAELIDQLVEIKRKWKLTPEQNRYVDRQTRQRLGLVIEMRPKKLPVYLTPSEIQEFFKTAQEISSKHRLLVELLIMTGLRINELCNVDILDFQSNNQLYVRHGKGGKERYVPISDSLRYKVQLFCAGRERGYLFLNRSNRQYTVRMLQYMVGEVIKRSGIEKPLTTHSLRHTFACLCLARGMSIEEVQLLMGHSSVKTTEIYARLELSAVKEKYLQLVGGSE
jgi:site-specific recombinase XerD